MSTILTSHKTADGQLEIERLSMADVCVDKFPKCYTEEVGPMPSFVPVKSDLNFGVKVEITTIKHTMSKVVTRIRNKVRSWCRYWHFNVTGVLSDNNGHSNYLHIVSTLDDWFGTDTWKKESLEESWPQVLNNIRACSGNQLLHIQKFCTSIESYHE